MKEVEALKNVKEFHETFGQPVLKTPQLISKKRAELRIELIQEELNELKKAVEDKNLVEVADALCDIQYVLSGTVLEFGMGDKFREMFDEVHRSNMSKACNDKYTAVQTMLFYNEERNVDSYPEEMPNGTILIKRKADGKILKSLAYSPANISEILKK